MKIFLKKTRDSEGYILFHSVFINKGRIRKGKIINANDIKLMSASGIEEIYVGSMEKGEIDENSASRVIGQAILNDNFSVSPTFSGKTNITSKYDGTPNVLGEAVAYKIPCLAPKGVGLSNLILLNGKGGYLYKPNSDNDFKVKLSSMLLNYKKAIYKSKLSYKELKRFGYNNTLIKLKRCINEIL